MEERTDAVLSLVSLLESGVTFAAYSLPGSRDLQYIIDDHTSPVVSDRRFIVTAWNGDSVEISDRAVDLAVRNSVSIVPAERSSQRIDTMREDYDAGIRKVTRLLQSVQGKVVISRMETMSDSRINFRLISECAFEMFSVYDNAFRAVYYTPSTGAWCVCSPELLLNVNKKSGELHTVALAGTRAKGSAGEWDEKNMREHSYVVTYICDVLKSLGINPVAHGAETVTAGNIQHILTRISGNISGTADEISIGEIVSALHPTPAICGYPLSWSKSVIEEVEKHDRECYGGYIAVDDDSRFLAHVNLRCFAFEPGHCCFWGGGGIMGESSPEAEWNESSMKISTTLSFIKNRLDNH